MPSYGMDDEYDLHELPEEDPADFFRSITTTSGELNLSFSDVTGEFNTVLVQVGPKGGPYTTSYLDEKALDDLYQAVILTKGFYRKK